MSIEQWESVSQAWEMISNRSWEQDDVNGVFSRRSGRMRKEFRIEIKQKPFEIFRKKLESGPLTGLLKGSILGSFLGNKTVKIRNWIGKLLYIWVNYEGRKLQSFFDIFLVGYVNTEQRLRTE